VERSRVESGGIMGDGIGKFLKEEGYESAYDYYMDNRVEKEPKHKKEYEELQSLIDSLFYSIDYYSPLGKQIQYIQLKAYHLKDKLFGR
jgi:hypothetical protein